MEEQNNDDEYVSDDQLRYFDANKYKQSIIKPVINPNPSSTKVIKEETKQKSIP